MTSVSQRVFASFKKTTANKKTAIPLSVQKVEMESASIARVVVNIPDVFHKAISNEELAAAVETSMPGARYLDNSISACDQQNLFTMFVTSTGKVMTKEAASAQVMREVASNVFRDDDDNIWNFKEDETGSYFVAQDVEDLEGLVLGVRSRSPNITTASLEVATAEAFSASMPVMVYDVASQAHAFGIAVDDSRVYFPGKETIHEVNPVRVVAAFEVAAGDRGMPKVSFTGKDKRKALLDYMRALYGHNAAHYKRIEALIRAHLKV